MVAANPPSASAVVEEGALGDKKRKRPGMSKFYGVAAGRNSGVYTTWSDCLAQVKGVKGSKCKLGTGGQVSGENN